MTRTDALELFRMARASRATAAGFYNRNVRVDTPSGPVIVRIPIEGADVMDLRLWREHEVLRGVAPYVDRAPRLLYASEDPAFQVHEFVAGELLDEIAPRGVAVPGFVLRDVADLFRRLVRVPRDGLPATPATWPEDGDVVAFASLLSEVTERVHAAYRDRYAALFRELGIPADPLGPAVELWPHLTPRPFRLVHSDIHRKNMIIEDSRVMFLDWEMSLWGDPLYDLAVHLHKMGYQPAERDAVVQAWVEAMPAPCARGWERDLPAYLAHERVKSAVVDTVRYAKLIAGGTLSPEQERGRVRRLAEMLDAAGAVWGRRGAAGVEDVARALRRDAARGAAPPAAG